MNKALVVACFLIAACGSPGTSLGASSGNQMQEPPVADVLEVICHSDGTRVETPRVRAFPDGVHARFENPAGATEYWVRAVTSPDEGNHGGRVPDGEARWRWWSDAPGEYYIACYDKDEPLPYYELDDRYARYEVVDIDHLWVSWDVECSQSSDIDNEPVPGAETQEDVFEWFRDRFDLPPGDFRRPGYPKTEWKGNPWVLVDEGHTIAALHPWKENSGWTITSGQACTN